jgi:uncharacterized pyridoxamine 5'-phosphate oxidase family protein
MGVRTWSDFAAAAPELATFGAERLHGKVAYLATIRPDGTPRVHPVTPIIGEGHLFVFMEPTSPKGKDLRRDPRYALHGAVSDTSGSGGEFSLSGRATFVGDAKLREVAKRVASYAPNERYILFELSVEAAASTVYAEDNTVRKRWSAA